MDYKGVKELKAAISSLRKDIVACSWKLYEKGYVAANDGNISARIDTERVLITPTRMSKGSVTPENLIIIDMSGKLLSGKQLPSSESDFHLKIYRDRPDVNGVCHAHPPYATGFAVAGIPMDKMVLPEVIIRLGIVPMVGYGLPGNPELYDQIQKKLKDHDAFLLANHGALTVGSSVIDSYDKMETLEHAAMIQFIAQMLGKVNVLKEDQVERLVPLREKFGARKGLSLE